jgi:hypothetical protein
MNNANVYISNIRNKKHQTAKSDRSAEHSCGNRKKVTNAIDCGSDKNEIIVLGEVVEAGDEAVEKIKKYIEELKPKATYGSADIVDRTKQKEKLNKWRKGKRTTDDEQAIFAEVIEHLDNKTEIPDALVEQFEELESKISRRNDKLKSLKSLQKSHNRITKSAAKGSQYDVVTVEKVFKITEKTDFELDAVEQRKMQVDFHNEHFPEYQIIYTAAHYDESKGHCHLMHSGKSDISGEFDYPDAELEAVKVYMSKNNIDCPWQDKTWFHLSTEETKEHGKVWQTMNYEHANKWIKNLGIDDWEFKKLEGEEKIKAHNQCANDPDEKKAITNRAFNNAELNKIKSEKLEEKMTVQEIEIENNEVIIEAQTTLLEKVKGDLMREYKRYKDAYAELHKRGRAFIQDVFKKERPEKIEKSALAVAEKGVNCVAIDPKSIDAVEEMIDEVTAATKNDEAKKKYNKMKIK